MKSRNTTKKLSKKRILTLCVLIMCGIFLILTIADLYISNFTLSVTKYTLENKKINESIRIVQLSDLHDKSFGKNNLKLIDKVKSQAPDIITLTGDIVDGNSENSAKYFSNLLESLKDIAPVYMCIGNHEEFSPYSQELLSVASEHGVILVDGNYTDVTIKGTEMRIGGLSYYRSWYEEHHQFLKDFSDTDRYTLLLCHYPEYYIWGVKNYPIDLMLSGHTHGGMIRLPFLGGLFAPEQRWFPEYDKGLFEGDDITLIISAGLGSSPRYLPRLNNPPEIVSIEIN